jgi:dUTP pyrophosphatase
METEGERNRMMKKRGFEVAEGWEEKEITLPVRMTKHAAGYDFEAGEEVTIQPLWKQIWDLRRIEKDKGEEKIKLWQSYKVIEPVRVSTGVKAYMGEEEMLSLYNRSSNPLKRFLLLGNGVGVCDGDYYGNETNDGNIQFQFINFGFFPVTIKKGERIGQGVFQRFLLADDDQAGGKRKGGHGSTDEKTK